MATVLASRGVNVTGPPDLTSGTATGPNDVIDVAAVNHLTPDGKLSSQDVLGICLGNTLGRVVRVDEPPVLRGSTPVAEGVVGVERVAVGEVDPLATAAVQVLYSFVSNYPAITGVLKYQTHVKVVVSVNDLVARLSQVLDGITTQPRLNDGVAAKS